MAGLINTSATLNLKHIFKPYGLFNDSCIKQGEGQCPCSSWVWDMTNPNAPVNELKAGSSLMCMAYNLKDANLIGGGQYNGQVSVFDTRKGSSPVDSSLMQYSHRRDSRELEGHSPPFHR